MLTIFTPIMTVWNLNEAVDEAKKQEPLDWEALILQLSEICRKALRRLPGALLVIPFLFLVEWMQAGTLHSIPLAVVYALLVLLDFWMVRRFWSMLPLPEAAPKPEPGKPVLRSQEQADDLLSLQKGARNFLFLGGGRIYYSCHTTGSSWTFSADDFLASSPYSEYPYFVGLRMAGSGNYPVRPGSV